MGENFKFSPNFQAFKYTYNKECSGVSFCLNLCLHNTFQISKFKQVFLTIRFFIIFLNNLNCQLL
uniref:Putative ovule protein n=1 Tax=Solanum chacoense TaxID=4108 RepID=A0A0V0GV17_SOLCH